MADHLIGLGSADGERMSDDDVRADGCGRFVYVLRQMIRH